MMCGKVRLWSYVHYFVTGQNSHIALQENLVCGLRNTVTYNVHSWSYVNIFAKDCYG